MDSHSSNPLLDTVAQLPPLHARIEEYLKHWASLTPHAEAVVDSNGRLTYTQLQDAVDKAAGAMAAQGVRDGDCVAVLAPPSVDFVVSFLAAATVGATWVGLNPRYTRPELQHVVEDARPALVLARSRVAGRDFLEDLRHLQERPAMHATAFRLLDDRDAGCGIPRFDVQGETPWMQHTPGNQVAMFVYTSGTTGRPKAACLSHRALIRAAAVRAQVWRVTPFRSINNLPINHVGSAGDIACTTLLAGGCQVCLERFTPAATLDCLHRERISFWYQVPTMFQMCLDAPESRHMDWSQVQAAIWSGGRASEQLIRRLASVARFVAVDYSMTESVGAITLSPLTDDPATLQDSVGWPDPGRECRLVDPSSLAQTPVGLVGEVQLRDPWMFEGYRGTGTAAEAFTSDGWFRTNDLAMQRPDGAWCIVGRSREMFKSGGYNVYPREIELVLEAHPEVAAAAVVETGDRLYGEVGIAFVVPKASTLDADVLTAHCRERLANYKIPKRFILVAELPILSIGKVDKQVLRKQAAAAHDQ